MNLDSYDIARLAYLLLILLSVGGWLIVSIKKDLGRTFQMALIWSLIFLGFFGVYGVWNDISDGFRKDEQFEKIADNVFQIKKSSDGHFYSTGIINNNVIVFLIDTGATKTILSMNDAKASGIDVSQLNFVNPIRTANGMGYSASYKVERFSWFERNFEGLDIQITNGDLFRSLLGMDIIDKSDTFLISGDMLQLSF